jgi:hypothetical protein
VLWGVGCRSAIKPLPAALMELMTVKASMSVLASTKPDYKIFVAEITKAVDGLNRFVGEVHERAAMADACKADTDDNEMRNHLVKLTVMRDSAEHHAIGSAAALSRFWAIFGKK